MAKSKKPRKSRKKRARYTVTPSRTPGHLPGVKRVEEGDSVRLKFEAPYISMAMGQAFASLGQAGGIVSIKYDPPDVPAELFTKIFSRLLPPPDEQHNYDREFYITELTQSALKLFSESEKRVLFSILIGLAHYAVYSSMPDFLERMGENEKTVRRFRPRAEGKEYIEGMIQDILGELLELHGSGGDRRSKESQDQWSDENCVQFARKVEELHPLWKHIKECYDDPSLSLNQWLGKFKQHRKGCHECQEFEKVYIELGNDLLAKLADTKLSNRDREPLALAYAHAALELGFPISPAQTLRRYYYKGKGILSTKP